METRTAPRLSPSAEALRPKLLDHLRQGAQTPDDLESWWLGHRGVRRVEMFRALRDLEDEGHLERVGGQWRVKGKRPESKATLQSEATYSAEAFEDVRSKVAELVGWGDTDVVTLGGVPFPGLSAARPRREPRRVPVPVERHADHLPPSTPGQGASSRDARTPVGVHTMGDDRDLAMVLPSGEDVRETVATQMNGGVYPSPTSIAGRVLAMIAEAPATCADVVGHFAAEGVNGNTLRGALSRLASNGTIVRHDRTHRYSLKKSKNKE